MLFEVATPMLMIAPINEGTFIVVRVTNSIHTIPAKVPVSAVMIINGSDQDWKFTTISKYTSTIEKNNPIASPAKDERIVATCPRMTIVVPARAVGS